MESGRTPKISCVAGARPNFMKVGPILRVLRARARFIARRVHTGQHHDARLSKVFFDDLRIPRPDFELAVGSTSHAVQTAEIMRRFEPVLRDERPEAVLVAGDVNSTSACALVAAKFVLDRPFATAPGLRRRPLVESHGERTRRVPRCRDGEAAERIQQTLAEIFHANT